MDEAVDNLERGGRPATEPGGGFGPDRANRSTLLHATRTRRTPNVMNPSLHRLCRVSRAET
jgi:hypothetical protein